MNSSIHRIALAAQRKFAKWSWLGDADIADINSVGAGTIPNGLSQNEYRQRSNAQNEIANNALRANKWQALNDYGTMSKNVALGAATGAILGPEYLPGGVYMDPGINALLGGLVGVGKGIHDIKGKRAPVQPQVRMPQTAPAAPAVPPPATPAPKQQFQQEQRSNPVFAQGR